MRSPNAKQLCSLLCALTLCAGQASAEDRTPAGHFPLPDSFSAWKRLPAAEKGAGLPLPAWARTLAGPLPRTTASLLELDYLHRVRSPLDPKFRARLRWVAAHANRCAYTEAVAVLDLQRAGLSAAEIEALRRGDWSKEDRPALAFARQMMLAAHRVTDDEVAALVKQRGDKQFVAMVLLLAQAAFQDRLILHLGLTAEEGGPLPPAEVRFVRKEGGIPGKRLGPRKLPVAAEPAPVVTGAEWPRVDFTQLQEKLDDQRARPPRIRVPSWD